MENSIKSNQFNQYEKYGIPFDVKEISYTKDEVNALFYIDNNRKLPEDLEENLLNTIEKRNKRREQYKKYSLSKGFDIILTKDETEAIEYIDTYRELPKALEERLLNTLTDRQQQHKKEQWWRI